VSASCDRREQRLLFVTGALDAAERHEFERHVAGCEACADVVWAAREALEEEPAPPLEVDAASLERVRARLLRSVRDGQPAPPPPPPAPAASRARWLQPALAAGLAAAGVGAVAWLLHRDAVAPLVESNEVLSEQAAVLEAERTRLEAQRDELRAQLDLTAREVDLLRKEDLVVVPLTATAAAAGAKARILWHAKSQRCYMTAHGLPPLDAGRRYVMWVVTATGKTILVGTFASNPAGEGFMYGELPKGTPAIDRVVITDEPEDLPSAPTGKERLVWSRPA
jgi:hypothetical protein